jgi:hypothetical protein
MNHWRKIAWGVCVLLVVINHLLIGTLLGIATAFYWLLSSRLAPATNNRTKNQPERLWCIIGKHWIGNEPYSFCPESEKTNADDAYCLKCREDKQREIEDMLKEDEELETKTIEWERLTEEERESRRAAAKATGRCPRCNKVLTGRDSCPLCNEFPFSFNARMNKGWREREWAPLSESEKQARIEGARARLSELHVEGSDGIWRRKDTGEAVESFGPDIVMEKAKCRFDWVEEKR